MVTQGVILAAGKGVRLDRGDSPKPLVRVGNKPLILWNIEQMQSAGISDIYIVIGYRGDEIKKELIGNPLVVARIHYIEQTADNSKAGMLASVLSLRRYIEGAFFLAMSDLIIEKNPYSLFPHIGEGEIATLVGAEEKTYKRAGALSKVVHADGRVVSVSRELPSYNGFEIGVYLIGGDVLGNIEARLERDGLSNFELVLQAWAGEGRLEATLLTEGEWFDVNTPSTHIRAEIFARNRLAKKREARQRPLQIPQIFNSFSRGKNMETGIIVERGIINRLGEIEILPPGVEESPHFILTDSIVDALYGSKVQEGFAKAGYTVYKIVIPPGESSKSAAQYLDLAETIFSHGMDKSSYIISLGGGVINNIAGYLASTLYRGIGLVHIPTSMMAQVDAAIDFKQAVNSVKGKNLLGSYYPAEKIIIDPDLLATLPERHVRNGIAESIKHALTQDPAFFDFLIKGVDNITNPEFLEEVVRKTVDLKVPLLTGDPADDRNEMLPQYGHSVGHAVEHLSSYDLLHGEAVSIGMCVSAEIAKLLGIADDETVAAHYDILKRYGLPTKVPDAMTDEDIANVIRYDKHYVKQDPHKALVQKVGFAWNDDGVHGIPIPYEILRRAIIANKERPE